MATHKVRPIKVKKIQVKDIPPGEFFSMNGTKFVMINPYSNSLDFASDVLVVINDECYQTMILGDGIAFIRAVVTTGKKGKF